MRFRLASNQKVFDLGVAGKRLQRRPSWAAAIGAVSVPPRADRLRPEASQGRSPGPQYETNRLRTQLPRGCVLRNVCCYTTLAISCVHLVCLECGSSADLRSMLRPCWFCCGNIDCPKNSFDMHLYTPVMPRLPCQGYVDLITIQLQTCRP